MRSGKFFFIAGLIMSLALIALVIGCSKDKNPVNTENPEDVQYNLVTSEVNSFLDTMVTQFAGGLEIGLQDDQNGQTDVVTTAYSPINPDSILTNGGWHVVYISDIVAGYTIFRVDSIQFQRNQVPQDRLSGADAIAIVHRLNITNPDTTANYRNKDVRSIYVISGINTSSATINGARTQVIETKIGDIKRTFNIDMSVSGVTVPKANDGWTKGCPESGLIHGTVDYTAQSSSSIPTTTTWNYSIEIDNGTVTATVTAGPYSKSYSAPVCTM